MWELDSKGSWAPKNWCFWTMVLEKTLESLLNCKEIKPVNPKGNQSWIFIGRTDAEAEAPVLRPRENRLIGKDPDAGQDWRQEEKGMTEDEIIGWHHQLDGHEFEQAPGVVDGQRSVAWCSPWGLKKSDTAKWLNWTEGTRGDIVRWRWWSNPRSIRTFDAIYLLWFLLSYSWLHISPHLQHLGQFPGISHKLHEHKTVSS